MYTDVDGLKQRAIQATAVVLTQSRKVDISLSYLIQGKLQMKHQQRWESEGELPSWNCLCCTWELKVEG